MKQLILISMLASGIRAGAARVRHGQNRNGECEMVELQPMETAPLDEMILLDVGLGFLTVGHWSSAEEFWAYAEIYRDTYSGGREVFFEGNWAHTEDCNGWVPLPRVR